MPLQEEDTMWREKKIHTNKKTEKSVILSQAKEYMGLEESGKTQKGS